MRQAWSAKTKEVRSDLTSRLIIMIINKSIGLTLDIDGKVLTPRSFSVQQFPEKLLPILCISCFKMSNLGVFKCHTLGYLWTLDTSNNNQYTVSNGHPHYLPPAPERQRDALNQDKGHRHKPCFPSGVKGFAFFGRNFRSLTHPEIDFCSAKNARGVFWH